jgi:hypothetical protein
VTSVVKMNFWQHNITEQVTLKRLTKRQGCDAIKGTVEDLLKAVVDPNLKLPTFYAVEFDFHLLMLSALTFPRY